MKPRDNAPITLTKMVGHFHFVDSCLFLVFFTRENFKGPRRHKRKGTAGEWGLAYSTGGPGKGEQPCPGAASAPWVTERVQPPLPWVSSQTEPQPRWSQLSLRPNAALPSQFYPCCERPARVFHWLLREVTNGRLDLRYFPSVTISLF